MLMCLKDFFFLHQGETMKKLSGFTLIEVLISISIVGILISVFMTGAEKGGGFINFSHGTGEKVGQIVLLNNRGFMNPTWEAQLIRGGMSNGSGAFGMQPFNFTIEDKSLREKVEQYRKSNVEVNISYRIEGICAPTRSESKCTFLTGIEPVKK
jgi:prepilin-type N-terminal cleavage/methylation domain-containing protein